MISERTKQILQDNLVNDGAEAAQFLTDLIDVVSLTALRVSNCTEHPVIVGATLEAGRRGLYKLINEMNNVRTANL